MVSGDFCGVVYTDSFAFAAPFAIPVIQINNGNNRFQWSILQIQFVDNIPLENGKNDAPKRYISYGAHRAMLWALEMIALGRPYVCFRPPKA